MKKETAIYPSHRKLLGTTLAAAIMTTPSPACSSSYSRMERSGWSSVSWERSSSEDVSASCSSCCWKISFPVKQADSAADSGQSADLRIGAKGIYITIEWQRIADFSVFRTYGQKFIRIELHDPDRAIDEENRIAKGLMRWQMKYFGSPYAITASTVDIGTAELEKSCGVFTGIPRKIRCELTDPPAKRFSEPIPHIVGNTLAPSVNESDQDVMTLYGRYLQAAD